MYLEDINISHNQFGEKAAFEIGKAIGNIWKNPTISRFEQNTTRPLIDILPRLDKINLSTNTLKKKNQHR